MRNSKWVQSLFPNIGSTIWLLIRQSFIRKRIFGVVTLLFGSIIPLYSQVHLVEWNFPNSPDDVLADNGSSGNLAQTISASDNRSILYFSGVTTSAASAYGWENGMDSKYWQISVNTSGFSTLFLSSRQRSSGTGPAGFKVIYSRDNGVSWNEIPSGLIRVADDWNTGILNIRLPDECSDQSNLLIRWQMSSNSSVNGEIVSGGTSRIDDILITGCTIFLNSFEPSNGPPGTRVTLTGTGFADVQSVSFNGIETSYELIDPNTILAKVPLSVSSGPITIKNSDCAAISAVSFQLLTTCPDNHSNLMISELCDPLYDYATTRYIEIYNPTNRIIDLQGWSVKAISNSKECFTWNLSGTINPGQALTCGNNNPLYGGPFTFTDPNWYSAFGCCISWNGERQDGAVLYNGNTIIDYVYYAPSNTGWFSDKTLVRNPEVCQPSATTNLNEWKTSAVTFAGTAPSTPGVHFTQCFSSVPVINNQPIDASVCENEPVSFSVTADGILPLNFQWKYYHETAGTWENIPGDEFIINNTANSSTILLTHAFLSFNHRQFYCEVRNSGQDCFQATRAVWIQVEDRSPPVLEIPPSLSFCVEKISSALYDSETAEINPDPPDYYTHIPGNTEMDLDPRTFRDNCMMSCDFQIRWRITFQNEEQIPPLPQPYYTGQPSTYPAEIRFPGDPDCLQHVNHLITYWIVDCSGNVSEPVNRIVTISPRPDLTLK